MTTRKIVAAAALLWASAAPAIGYQSEVELADLLGRVQVGVAERLQTLTSEDLTELNAISPSNATWILEHKAAMLADLNASGIEAGGGYGCMEPFVNQIRLTPIRYSYLGCLRSTVTFRAAATKLLDTLIERTPSENTGERWALAPYLLLNWLSPEEVGWSRISTQGTPFERKNASIVLLANGNEVLVWGGFERRLIDGDTPSDTYPYEWIAVNSGAIYNPAAGTWRPISSEGAPSARGGAGIVLSEGRIFIHGGAPVLDSWQSQEQMLGDGGIYDPQTNTWQSIPDHPAARRLGALHVLGEKLFIFGSMEGGGPGVFYDLATGGYWEISTEDAPKIDGQNSVPYIDPTGRTFIYTGSCYWQFGCAVHERPPIPAIFRYDIDNNRWDKILESRPDFPLTQWSSLGSTGTELIFWSGAAPNLADQRPLKFYNPLANEWHSGPPSPAMLKYAFSLVYRGGLIYFFPHSENYGPVSSDRGHDFYGIYNVNEQSWELRAIPGFGYTNHGPAPAFTHRTQFLNGSSGGDGSAIAGNGFILIEDDRIFDFPFMWLYRTPE